MARHGIRYEDVVEAIQALQEQGQAINVPKIREYLGTGSFSTINEHLRTWRMQVQQHPESTLAAQQGYPLELQRLFSALWQQACDLAMQTLEQERQQARAQVEAAQKAQEEANLQQAWMQQALEKAEAAQQAVQETHTQTRLALEQAHERVHQLQHQQTDLQQALAHAEQKYEQKEKHWLQEMDQMREHLKQKNADISQMHHQLEVAQLTSAQQEAMQAQTLAQLENQIQGLKAQIETQAQAHQEALQTLIHEHEQEQKARRLAEHDMQDWQKAYRQQGEQIRTLQADLQTCLAKNAQLHEDIGILRAHAPFPTPY